MSRPPHSGAVIVARTSELPDALEIARNVQSSNRLPPADSGCREPDIRFTPLPEGNDDQKCLIQSVLLNKCLPSSHLNTAIGVGPNMRRRLITHKGRTQSVTAWEYELGLSPKGIQNRLRAGWSIQRALETRHHPTKGRPRTGRSTNVTITLPPEIVEIIDQLAKAEQRTRAGIIRQFVIAGIKRGHKRS